MCIFALWLNCSFGIAPLEYENGITVEEVSQGIGRQESSFVCVVLLCVCDLVIYKMFDMSAFDPNYLNLSYCI